MPHARATALLLALGIVSPAASATFATRLHAQDTSAVLATTPAGIAGASSALLALLAAASRGNAVPPTLLGYRALVETEMGVLLHREDGTELAPALEQFASTLEWARDGLTRQHVIGYRSRGTVLQMSANVNATGGWLTPILYGNRLRIRTQRRDTSVRRGGSERRGERRDGSDTLPAVHPLATDRERFYRYSGGDTVTIISAGGREIPIVRVRVQPREAIRERVLLFDGELDLDASRGALVRMRGHFVRVNAGLPRSVRVLIDPVAFIEYENGEFDGKYWLPARQRIELQVASPLLGDASAVIRIISRFSEVAVRDTVTPIADAALLPLRRRLSYAPNDSLDRFTTWDRQIGEVTGSVNSNDFADVGPDRMRVTGKPRVDVSAPRLSDVLHFNRIEGLYTGLGVRASLRDAAPGVVVRATAGYAWNEGTVRGRMSVERTRGTWTTELRAGRALDNTNDFRTPFDSGSTIAAVFGSRDPYDYVDRRSFAVGVMRLDRGRTLRLRADVGVTDDRYRGATYIRSPLGGNRYRANRSVDEGSYFRTAALLDLSPTIAQNVLFKGASARITYERGDGTLDFQRVEARATVRHWFGPFLAAVRGDAGVVTGARIPTQMLFEIGQQQGLPGYDYKEFAGSRAAMLRAQLMYQSRYFPRPIRLLGAYTLPAIAPGASVGIQGGWTEAPTAAARDAILRLGTRVDSTGAVVPVSRVTDGGRATASAGLRFFGGGLFVGFARPIDQAAKWRGVFSGAVLW